VAVNVGALVGHTPVRTFVMGADAVAREATPAEVDAMRRLVREALEAGALGFATSKAPTHVGYGGHPVPSRAASSAEIEALAGELAHVSHGVMQCTIGPGLSFDEFEAVARATGKPVSWTALLAGLFGPKGHRPILERFAKLQAEGVRVVPQVSCRPLSLEFQWKAPFPFESQPELRPVSAADFDGRRRIYGDPAFRAALRARVDGGALRERFYGMVLSEHAPDPSLCERTVEALAAERGVHPVDLALDLALAAELESRFRFAAANTDEEDVAELLAHPASMLGLSDAGAHASQLCDAGAPTTLLGKWVREKRVLTLEEGVRRLTGEPAEIFGLRWRGRLATGLAADVTVFDPETVGCEPVRRVFDFPCGADRLVADATGIRFVIVNGSVIRENGRDALGADEALPGQLLRGGQA
jgi:N-acyl-D-aspartate/D-glutamate deacylase